MPEYGRIVFNMVESLKAIPEKDVRTRQAHAIIHVMEILNPQVHQQDNFEQKLWDHLYIMSGFDLDVDAPYPCPEPKEFETRPVQIPMKGTKIKASHYGRNIERMINLLCDQPDGDCKTAMIKSLAVYMRQQYLIWNKDSVADETIFSDIEKLSDFRIKVPEGMMLDKISSDLSFNRPGLNPKSGNNQKRKGRRNNFKKK